MVLIQCCQWPEFKTIFVKVSRYFQIILGLFYFFFEGEFIYLIWVLGGLVGFFFVCVFGFFCRENPQTYLHLVCYLL